MIKCARAGCDELFVPGTHNQKYHSNECCRIATNQRIMEKYYAKRDQRNGVTRYCDTCEKTKLSRYNDDTTCNSCNLKQQVTANKTVANMLLAVAWQA